MQRVTLVRYKAKPARAEENEALSRAVFAELRAQAPDGVTYALFRDGPDFVHLFVNSEADDSNVLTELPTFKVFSKEVSERCEAPPEVTRLSLNMIESYGLASAMAPA
jgi:quinol monooxygenase YgiN